MNLIAWSTCGAASLWWVISTVALAEAESPPPPASRPPAASVYTNRWSPVTSHSRTFMVTAMPSRDALEIALWAEAVRERLTVWTGRPLSAEKMFPLVIAAELQPDVPRGWVKWAQDVTVDGRLRQEMTLVNPALMDQEDALETLCGLLINRYIFATWRTTHQTPPPLSAPDWLVVGVAQQLYPDLRERNLATLGQAEQAGLSFAPDGIFHLKTLPPGRWPEKAQAGLVVGWLGDSIGTATLFSLVTDQLTHRKLVTAADVWPRLGCTSGREFSMSWEVWRAGQERKFVPGVLSRNATSIQRLLAALPEDVGVLLPKPHASRPLLPDLLLSAREQAWAKAAARRLSLKLGEAMAGKAPELTAIAMDFLSILRAITDPLPKRSAKKEHELVAQFQAAQARLDAYTEKEEARSRLLDAFTPPAVDDSEAGRDALRQMLDQWDATR